MAFPLFGPFPPLQGTDVVFRVMHAKFLPAAAFTISVVLMAGCGPARSSVSGTVSLDNKPVDGGSIVFIAADSKGVNVNADIIDGKYALEGNKGPAVGAYRVEIVWHKKTGKQVVGSDPPNKVDETIQVIPAKYNLKATEKVEIKSGSNTFNYDLKSK